MKSLVNKFNILASAEESRAEEIRDWRTGERRGKERLKRGGEQSRAEQRRAEGRLEHLLSAHNSS